MNRFLYWVPLTQSFLYIQFRRQNDYWVKEFHFHNESKGYIPVAKLNDILTDAIPITGCDIRFNKPWLWDCTGLMVNMNADLSIIPPFRLFHTDSFLMWRPIP